MRVTNICFRVSAIKTAKDIGEHKNELDTNMIHTCATDML